MLNLPVLHPHRRSHQHTRMPACALIVGLLLNVSTAFAQTTAPQQTSLGGSILQMLFGLAIVIALLIGGLWVLKKVTAPTGNHHSLLRIVGGTAIGTRERIVVVEIGQTWLVLGVTPHNINTLAEMPRQALPPNTQGTQSPAVAKWLQSVLGQRNGR